MPPDVDLKFRKPNVAEFHVEMAEFPGMLACVQPSMADFVRRNFPENRPDGLKFRKPEKAEFHVERTEFQGMTACRSEIQEARKGGISRRKGGNTRRKGGISRNNGLKSEIQQAGNGGISRRSGANSLECRPIGR